MAIAAVLLPAGDAWGHASFLESTPAPGERLAEAPPELELEFTEPLNERLTKFTLVDATSGEEISADGQVTGSRRLRIAPERRLSQAAYRIDWHSVSTVDGHVKQGSISFGVGTGALGGLELERSPFATGGWLRIPLRGVLYVALFFFAGGLFAAALTGRRAQPRRWLLPEAARAALAGSEVDAETVVGRAWRRTIVAGWVAAGAALAVALVEAVDAAGTAAPASVADFLLSNGAGLARVATVVALVLAAAAAPRRPGLAAAFGAGALAAVALSGHANSADQRAAALASDWVHLVAGAVWVGGLAQLAAAWLPATRRAGRAVKLAVARAVLPAFGRVALPAFLVVAVTGLLNALIQLGEPAALWETGYGRVLAVKIALVAGIALASYLHAFRLRPKLLAANPHPAPALERRHWRLVASEPFMGVGVLAVAALLVAFPLPPSQTGEARALPACDPCPLAKPAADELAVAEPAGELTVAAWLRRDDGDVAGTLRVLTDRRKPAMVVAEIAGAERQTGCGRGCWSFRLPGDTQTLAVRVRRGHERHEVRLPARWREDEGARARRILSRAQRAMRALETLRQTEVVTSAPGYTGTTQFSFDAPDRMRWESEAATGIVVENREWLRTADLPWSERPAAKELPVRPGKRFRWDVFLPSARLLDVKRDRGRRVADLAFFDYGYPVWYRMRVDLETNRVLTARLTTPANRIEHRYYGFDKPLRIEPPAASIGGS